MCFIERLIYYYAPDEMQHNSPGNQLKELVGSKDVIFETNVAYNVDRRTGKQYLDCLAKANECRTFYIII